MLHKQLFEMDPILSIEDVACLRLADSELKGDVFLKHRPFQSADLKNIFTRQFRRSADLATGAAGQTGSVGMLHVLRTINPLKVVNHIIGFITVNMVDVISGGISIRNKRKGYQSVNPWCRLFIIATERCDDVSEFTVDRKLEDPTRPSMPALLDSLNPSTVTDRIKRFVSRCRFPLFNIHSYQCKPSPVWSQL